MVHPLEMLADDVEVRIGHQMMDVGDAAGDGIFDCDHRECRMPFADCGEGVVELGAGEGEHIGEDTAAREV